MKKSKIKMNRLLAITFAGTQFAGAAVAADDTSTNNPVDIETLKQQIQTLSEEVRVLQRQQQEDEDTSTKAAANSPHLSIGADGASFSSANTNFVYSLHGLVQVDSRTFFQNGRTAGIDGFLLRRARPIFTGTLYHNFDFNFTPDFGGSTVQIFDAYLNYHYNPDFQLQAGKYKPPVGLEALQADNYVFFNERSIATDLVPNRDVGVELHGDVDDHLGGTVSYAAGIFNGLPDYVSTTVNTPIDNDVAFAGRIFALPFKKTSLTPLQGLGIGVSGSYEHDDTNAVAAALTPGYTTDGQEKMFTYAGSTVPNGAHWRVSPQGYYYYGPFGLMGEYVVSDQHVTDITTAKSADIDNTAWEVSAGWVLTGENDTYNGVVPNHPFDPLNGGFGAWQVVGRYAELDIDKDAFPTFASAATAAGPTSATGAREWSVGLNWYLNKDLRANVSFSHTWFTGDANGNAVTKQPENVLFTRMQVAF